MYDVMVHLKCGYIYTENSEEKSATYISSKSSQNLNYVNPNVIASRLANEILVETGRVVKSFLYVGKEPVKSKS